MVFTYCALVISIDDGNDTNEQNITNTQQSSTVTCIIVQLSHSKTFVYFPSQTLSFVRKCMQNMFYTKLPFVH